MILEDKTKEEKIKFIVDTELTMMKAMRKGHKLSRGDEFEEARTLMEKYRKELNLVRPEPKV